MEREGRSETMRTGFVVSEILIQCSSPTLRLSWSTRVDQEIQGPFDLLEGLEGHGCRIGTEVNVNGPSDRLGGSSSWQALLCEDLTLVHCLGFLGVKVTDGPWFVQEIGLHRRVERRSLPRFVLHERR